MRYKMKGLDKYIERLESLSNPYNAQVCIENAVTEGSKVVSQMTLAELEKMPVDNRPFVKDGMRTGVTQKVKNELIKSFGITPLDIKGNTIDRKTGVDYGYNGVATRKYPKGQPNIVIARSLEKGTSFMPKNPVISRASRKARKPCIEAMKKSFEDDIERIMVNNQKRLQRSKI